MLVIVGRTVQTKYKKQTDADNRRASVPQAAPEPAASGACECDGSSWQETALLTGRSVQRANLIAVWITQIGQVEFAHRAFAPSRGVFAGGAAIGDTGRMKRIRLCGRLHVEPDGAAIAVGGWRAVDGDGDAERARGAALEIAAFVGDARADAERAQQRVIKRLRHFKTIDTKHHVAEHRFFLLNLGWGSRDGSGWRGPVGAALAAPL